MRLLKRKKPEALPVRSPRDSSGRTAPVFSYYSKRSTDTESQSRNFQGKVSKHSRRKPSWLNYLPSIISLLVVLGATGYFTTLAVNPRVTILNNANQPTVVQPVSVYEKTAQEVMKGSILNRSKITIDTNKLANQLEAEFPELGDIVVTIPLIGRRPLVQTRPATPSLILVGKNGSFVIDDLGRPVLKADQLASSVRDELPVVSDSSDNEIALGRQLLTTELVSFVQTIHAQLASKNLAVETYTLPTLTNELHIKLAGKGYYIKFNTEADARLQVGTYLAVQERLDSENKAPSEYIDVRVEERAYYR